MAEPAEITDPFELARRRAGLQLVRDVIEADIRGQVANEREAACAAIAAREAAADAFAEATQPGDDITEGAPPSASELDIDITDLSPARAQLVCYLAWVDRKRESLRALSKVGATPSPHGRPAVTETESAELQGVKARGLIDWMLRGGRAQGPDPCPRLVSSSASGWSSSSPPIASAPPQHW